MIMTEKKPTTESGKKSARVRYSKTLFVDKIELDPEFNFLVVTRNSYILELPVHHMQQLYEFLGKRLEASFVSPCRIKVVGREVE